LKLFSFKKSQEEMLGFALIVVLVAVILLVFLGIALRTNSQESVESYEIENFVLSSLQQTTDCRNNLEFLNVRKLIFQCNGKEECSDEKDSCKMLNEVISNMLDAGFNVEEGGLYKGYNFEIRADGENMLNLTKGQLNGNYKGASQEFVKEGKNFEVLLKVYED
jgi:hypothetical protein